MTIPTGAEASIRLTVGDADTAAAVGSGDVPALATPRLLALCEGATVAAVAPHLERGETTVGVRVELDHLAASGTGAEVVARAVLESVERRTLVFAVEAADAYTGRVVARGTVRRVVVERARFLERLG
jgi:fluoroacetyl-CoA thioesterase